MSSPRPLRRLGLLTTLDTTVGDDFIREGLLHVVQCLASGGAFRAVSVNKHEPHTAYPRWHPIRNFYGPGFTPLPRFGRVRRFCERHLPPFGFSRFDGCDLILQCGTPIIWQGCRDSEWARMIWREIFARLATRGVPILNLGGGSCYPWERQPATLAGDQDEAFVRLMLGASRITTVRDHLARTLFESIAHPVPQICCPAFLAGQTFASVSQPTRKVLINYMSGGGHYDWGQNIVAADWSQTMRRLVDILVQQDWEPLFVAHNREELELATLIWPKLPRALPASSWEYFRLAEGAAFGVFNRMHASVAVAGLGIPSIAVGTDTRNLMVEALGLPVFYVKDATLEKMQVALDRLIAQRDAESTRLLALREQTLREYENILRPFVAA